MLHEDIKQARLAAGLTVSEVSRLANIPRKQVYALENGENVTLDTVRRIASVIPGLQRATLGGMNVVMSNIDVDEARQAALGLFAVTKRLIAALGAPASPVVIQHGSGSETERQTALRLEKAIAEGKHKRRRKAS
jgi:transcriptional regulator with XRE-family HTH domain